MLFISFSIVNNLYICDINLNLKNMPSQMLLSLVTSIIFTTITYSQCATAPATQTCAVGCTPLINNANVNSGQTFCYTGSGSLSGINMNGGTIIVCGSLTITSMNYNAGTFYVGTGSSLNFNMGNVSMGNATIVNYGTVTASGDVTMQPATFYNASATSIFNVAGKLTLNNTSQLINNGTLSAGTLLIQTSSIPALCLNTNTQNSFGTLLNNTSNSISTPNGTACIYVSTQTLLNPASLTTSTNLQLCQATSSTIGGPGGVGAATVYMNCSACSIGLSVNLFNFDAYLTNRETVLDWSTENENNAAYFGVERSQNGLEFKEIGQRAAAGNSTSLINYQTIDKDPYIGVSYYRLRMVDVDGFYTYSSTKSIYNAPFEMINLHPNPADNELFLQIGSPRNMDVKLEVYDNLGKIVQTKHIAVKTGYHTIGIDVSTLSQAVYRFKITTDTEGEQIESIFIKK